MTQADKEKFVNLMASVAELYREKLSIQRLEIYWRCLQQYSFELIQKALDAHAVNPDNGQFMPKPADIVRYLAGNSISQVLQAWTNVKRAIREVGCYSSIVFDDPLIHIIILEMGGWIQLCKIHDKDMPFKQHEFEKRYCRYLQVKPTDFPKQLIGITNQINQQNGFSLEPPILFGNYKQALIVYEQGKANAMLKNQTPLLINQTAK